MKEDWEDYYEILGVSPDSSAEEIKKAYRDACLIYHPDRLMNAPESARRRAEEELKRVNRAYDILGHPQKRQEYYSEWIRRKAKPKPVVNPDHIYFKDVKPGEIKVASFVVKNMGGPYERLFISNPDSWVRVVHYFSLTDSDELPLQVEIEAEGENWGKNYSEFVRVKLDEEETQVKVELETEPEPVKEKVKVGARPSTGATYTPPPPPSPPPSQVSVRRGMPAWAKWFIGMAVLGLIAGLAVQLWPSGTESFNVNDFSGTWVNQNSQTGITHAFIEVNDNDISIALMAKKPYWEENIWWGEHTTDISNINDGVIAFSMNYGTWGRSCKLSLLNDGRLKLCTHQYPILMTPPACQSHDFVEYFVKSSGTSSSQTAPSVQETTPVTPPQQSTLLKNHAHYSSPGIDNPRLKANLKEWINEHYPGIKVVDEVQQLGRNWMVLEDYSVIGDDVWAIGSHFGGYGYIFHSSDGGDNWELQWKEPEKLFGGLYPFIVYFSTETEGWVGGKDGLLYTGDGGKNWEFRSGSSSKYAGSWISEFWIRNDCISVRLRNGEYYKSFDGGITW